MEIEDDDFIDLYEGAYIQYRAAVDTLRLRVHQLLAQSIADYREEPRMAEFDNLGPVLKLDFPNGTCAQHGDSVFVHIRYGDFGRYANARACLRGLIARWKQRG